MSFWVFFHSKMRWPVFLIHGGYYYIDSWHECIAISFCFLVWCLKSRYLLSCSFLSYIEIVVVEYLFVESVSGAWSARYYRSKFEVIGEFRILSFCSFFFIPLTCDFLVVFRMYLESPFLFMLYCVLCISFVFFFFFWHCLCLYQLIYSWFHRLVFPGFLFGNMFYCKWFLRFPCLIYVYIYIYVCVCVCIYLFQLFSYIHYSYQTIYLSIYLSFFIFLNLSIRIFFLSI